jgi:hypothetical protein
MGQTTESIPALDRELYTKLKDAGIACVFLHWSGGSDEGELSVGLYRARNDFPIDDRNLETAVENWAYDAFQYSGAGDGNDYGDDYIYDLRDHTVTHSEWFHQRVEGDTEQQPLRLDGAEQQPVPAVEIEDPPSAAYTTLEKLYGAGTAEEILGRLKDAGLGVFEV